MAISHELPSLKTAKKRVHYDCVPVGVDDQGNLIFNVKFVLEKTTFYQSICKGVTLVFDYLNDYNGFKNVLRTYISLGR